MIIRTFLIENCSYQYLSFFKLFYRNGECRETNNFTLMLMITFPLILKWTNVSFVRYFTFRFLILKTSLNCDLSTSEYLNEISIHLLKLFIFISVAISVWIRLCTGVLTIIAQSNCNVLSFLKPKCHINEIRFHFVLLNFTKEFTQQGDLWNEIDEVFHPPGWPSA